MNLEEGTIIIHNRGVALCLKPNGDILINQKLAENDQEVVAGMRRLVAPQAHLISRLSVLTHRIKNVSHRQPIALEEGYKMVDEFADEMLKILSQL